MESIRKRGVPVFPYETEKDSVNRHELGGFDVEKSGESLNSKLHKNHITKSFRASQILIRSTLLSSTKSYLCGCGKTIIIAFASLSVLSFYAFISWMTIVTDSNLWTAVPTIMSSGGKCVQEIAAIAFIVHWARQKSITKLTSSLLQANGGRGQLVAHGRRFSNIIPWLAMIIIPLITALIWWRTIIGNMPIMTIMFFETMGSFWTGSAKNVTLDETTYNETMAMINATEWTSDNTISLEVVIDVVAYGAMAYLVLLAVWTTLCVNAALFQFVIAVTVVTREMKYFVKSMQTHDLDNEDTLEKYLHKYRQFLSSVERLEDMVKWFNLLFISCSVIGLANQSYFILRPESLSPIEQMSQGGDLLCAFAMLGYALIILFFTCGYPAVLNQLIEEPSAILLSSPKLWYAKNANVRELVDAFHARVSTAPRITMGGLFAINTSFVATIASFIVTYLILLLQSPAANVQSIINSAFNITVSS